MQSLCQYSATIFQLPPTRDPPLDSAGGFLQTSPKPSLWTPTFRYRVTGMPQ